MYFDTELKLGQKMIRRKSNKVEQEKTQVEKRIAKLPSDDLTKWADQALYGIGRNMSDWTKTVDPTYLDEAKLGAEALVAVMTELQKRYDSLEGL